MIKINKIDILLSLTILVAIGNSKTAITAISEHPQEELFQLRQTLDGSESHYDFHTTGPLAIDSEGKVLAFASSDGTIPLYEEDAQGTFKLIQILKDNDRTITSIAFGSDNILAAGSHNEILLWERNTDGKYALKQRLTDSASLILSY